MNNLPGKTIERLSAYRRVLLNYLTKERDHIFSHDLAKLLYITAVQVRRDVMLIGNTGMHKNGYNVKKLIARIGEVLDSKEGQKVAIVGFGYLGKAITGYFAGKRSKLNVLASFDINPKKVGTEVKGVKCFHISNLKTIIRNKKISIAILTVPPDVAPEVTNKLVEAGIKGILNFTTVPLSVPPGVYLEENDMITSVEKVAFFVKENDKTEK
ncbi:MAG: redox-sensing transcriptional repressor Rex [Bacteroidales bacterium]|nr:redox-sensing transcriptional repressor Rex [Bacteroidales bacterium]